LTDSELFDTTIWLDYLIKGSFKEKIEQEDLFSLSALSLFEIKRKLLKINLKDSEINEKMSFIKNKNIIVNIDEKIAEKAADISSEKNLPAIDSLIYATSLMNKLKLISLDNDFRGLDNVEILEI
jgi:predicted nucleic acid-binding protein